VHYRGENRYQELLSAARGVSAKISELEGVVGILATGGLGRGYCDIYSDLDMIVYADEERKDEIAKIVSVGVMHHGIDLDIEVRSYQEAFLQEVPSAYWSQVNRWDHQNSQTMYDPKGLLNELMKEKLIFPEAERRELMDHHRSGLEEQLRINFELWEGRGEIHNLAHSIRSGVEHFVLWIYARNGEFQPFLSKWMFYHLENDFVPESEHLELIVAAYTAPLTTPQEARDMRDRLLDLCSALGMEWSFGSIQELLERNMRKWEECSDLSKYYLSW
jgi:hypothetical protein